MSKKKRKRIYKGMLVASSDTSKDKNYRKFDIEVRYTMGFIHNNIVNYKLLGLKSGIKLN